MALRLWNLFHGIIGSQTYVTSNAEPAEICFQVPGRVNKNRTTWSTGLILKTIGCETVYVTAYARYNTNLSRVRYGGVDLFDDILAHIRDWQICASLDGTEQIGEYIRTGLDYAQFCRNFEHGLKYATNPRQMRLDFTLTLPGMFETGAMEKLSQTYGVQLLAKVIFSFSPDIVMSPLALPRHLLDPWVDELAGRSAGDMRDVLLQLKNRPCFEEQWPDTYRAGLAKGKARVLQLESIRTQKITMAEILAQRPAVLEWWNKIA